MNLPTISEIKDLRGKKVLLRLDLNVPIENGIIQDTYRIERSKKTLEYLKKEGAKVIVISHIGEDGSESLEAVAKYLNFPLFPLDINDNLKKKVDELAEGGFLMLENLRKDPGEKKNDPIFAQKLASLADIYVNEAFSVSHRKHSSVVGVPKSLPSYFGFLFEEEVANLSQAFDPERPFVFILGGAKFETKLPLVEKFLNIADEIFIGGALANSFFREMGYEIGKSKVDEARLDLKSLINNKKVIIPEDVIIGGADKISKQSDEVGKDDSIMDVGPKFVEKLKDSVKKSKFVLWNGPLGYFEGGYDKSTEETAKAIVGSGARSMIGGGDTLSAISELGILDKFSFVSTGGGAMLDFLANGTLPGIEIITN